MRDKERIKSTHEDFTHKMENCLNSQNTEVNPSFTLTSRVISNGAFEKSGSKSSSAVGDYVSTVDQTSIATSEQNAAIVNNWRANFVLNSSNSINNYNNMIKKAQMCA